MSMAGSKVDGSVTVEKNDLSSYRLRDGRTSSKDTQRHHRCWPVSSSWLVFKARPTGRLKQAAGGVTDSPMAWTPSPPLTPHKSIGSNDRG